MTKVAGKIGALIKSASIILCRQSLTNLQILLMKRKPNMSFGSVWVSPGGVCDPPDMIFKQFLDYGKITALRQTYEETGLLVIPQHVKVDLNNIPQKQEDINSFIIDIWSPKNLQQCLIPVLRLLTIQIPIKRFDTIFYILNNNVKILNVKHYRQSKKSSDIDCTNHLVINQQSTDYKWAQPHEFLQKYFLKQVMLMPPQVMILNALMNIGDIKKLQAQAKKMSVQPVMMQQIKGEQVVFMLPSDKQYNLDMILDKEPQSESKDQLIQIYRAKVRNSFNRFILNPNNQIQQFQLQNHPYDLLHLVLKNPKL